MARLTDAERATLSTRLPHWSMVAGRDAIERRFEFRDFSEAWGFMNRVALLAESQNHHPDWSNSYDTVVIDIVNHAAGGVTQRCIELAIDVEAIRREMTDPPL